ncbi:MAG: hypothetical protein CMO35_12175, partial [Verrucomicrobiaceae bacterium]|nr:hypothetical protein [Verrucomicrobiaceae bacterium]
GKAMPRTSTCHLPGTAGTHQKTALVTNVLGDEGFASNLGLEDLQFILSHGGEMEPEGPAAD